ncbi:MAG: hypothetical protein AABX51_07520 [Nanoarchaeota archaeon]
MKKLIALILIVVLLFMAVGCQKQSKLEVDPLEDNLEVPENDINIPEETISTELDSTQEPDFGSVI